MTGTLSVTVLDPVTGKTGVVTATLPPIAQPASSGLLIGGTLRDNNPSDASKTGYAAAGRPKWDIVRTYNQGDALKALSTGWGRAVATSYTPTCSPGWSKVAATRTTILGNLTGLPDVKGNRVISSHEFDNPAKYGTDFQTYLADDGVFWQLVQQVNASRRYPLIHVRCCMAYSISQPDRNLDAFYGTGSYDEAGMDVYSLKQITDAVNFAAKHGHTGCVPEMGPLSAIPQNDPAMLSYAQTGFPAFAAAGFTWDTWFDVNGAGADLDQYPRTLDYLRSLIVG